MMLGILNWASEHYVLALMLVSMLALGVEAIVTGLVVWMCYGTDILTGSGPPAGEAPTRFAQRTQERFVY